MKIVLTSNSKVISKNNNSYKAKKNDEVKLNNLKQNIFKRFEETVSTKYRLIQFYRFNYVEQPYQKTGKWITVLRVNIKEKNILILFLISSNLIENKYCEKKIENKYCESNSAKFSNGKNRCL